MLLVRLRRVVHLVRRPLGSEASGGVWRNEFHSRLSSTMAATLDSRAVLEISGVDAKALLQGLMTNDMSLLDRGEDGLPCISAAFLNPKGRVLADALVTISPRHEAKKKVGYLLDCPLSVAAGLKSHLKLYKLRSKVKIKDATSSYDVLVRGVRDPWSDAAADGEKSSPSSEASDGLDIGAAQFADPRCSGLGVRLIRPKDGADMDGASWPGGDRLISEDCYHAVRMLNGVGEGSELLDSIPLESNLDLLGSISFTKGCYVGQELTARTQFKGFVRKRVLPVLFLTQEIDAPALPVLKAPGVVEDPKCLNALVHLEAGVVPPAAGSGILDREKGDAKLGALVAAAPGYNVGLALLRLGKIMSPITGTDVSENFAVDCRLPEHSVEGKARRCLPLTPPWWPKKLDPTTGKVLP